MRKYYYPSEIHPKSCKSLATELAFNRELHQVVSTVFLLTYGADNDLTEAREEWARYRKRPRSWTHPRYTTFLKWVFCDPPSLYPVLRAQAELRELLDYIDERQKVLVRELRLDIDTGRPAPHLTLA